MNGTLATAATGLNAFDTRMQFISNNLANSQTIGFKQSSPEFATLMTINVRQPSNAGGAASAGLQVGTGVGVIGTTTDFSQGQPIQTGKPLDFMINGDGFLPVTKDDGTRLYTRSASLIVNADGLLSTADNMIVDPEITIPQNASSIKITPNGKIEVQLSGDTDVTEIGQIQLVRFMNNNGLKKISGTYFQKNVSTSGDEITGDPNADGFGSVMQGYLEGSNVNATKELVAMIETQRGYEQISKTMTASSDMMKTLNQSV
ncbi:flagellar basal-body rod protein FlgG [Photobacterium damselae]|uniref:flagellar basal-body rod protein FlgG n=1 Tax=Photobacterium damselae TaxID=38293 RepID=UPI0040689F3E